MFFSIITYNFLPTVKLLARYNRCLLSLLPFTYSYTLDWQSYRDHIKEIQEFCESRFGGSRKDRYFLRIIKWQHKLFRDYKRGKLVSFVLNNAAKTDLYGLKVSENIEIVLNCALSV